MDMSSQNYTSSTQEDVSPRFISQSLIVISPAHKIFKLKKMVIWLCKINIRGKILGRTTM